MNYVKHAIVRLLQLIPVMIGVTILVFLLTRALPGDPVRIALGPYATPEQIEHLRHLWGLDQPLHVQYINYVRGLFYGDWGISIVTRDNVLDDIIWFFPATFELTLVAMSISTLLGIPLGIISATRKDSAVDHGARLLSLGGAGLPTFWTGLLLQIVIVSLGSLLPISGRIGVAPPYSITGLYILDSLITLNWDAFWSSLSHIILPAFTLSLPALANISRITRTKMIDQTSKDYVSTARANGMPESLIVYVYMFRNAFSASLTMITLMFGYSMAGAVLVESVFNWPGMGHYLVKAIHFTDVNAIVGVAIVVGLSVVLANFVADLLYGYLDPRIRYGE